MSQRFNKQTPPYLFTEFSLSTGYLFLSAVFFYFFILKLEMLYKYLSSIEWDYLYYLHSPIRTKC